ncbi:MAG: hypothetical protein JXB14_01050 [Candidatus Altiarchaeota archaeon]|nr:hypothetical protein [Candidatus Altiarchaeota archaeon]
MGVLATIALILGIYLIFQAEKAKKKNTQVLFAITGLIAALWGLLLLFGGSIPSVLETPVLAFGVFALLAFYTKGTTQAIAGVVAIIVFLGIIL